MTSYATNLNTPDIITTAFLPLMNFGRVTFTPGDRFAKVYLCTDDLYRLAVNTRLMQDQYNAATGWANTIDRPTPTEQPDVYLAKVPVTEDVRCFFDHLTGLSAAQYTPGSPTVTLTFEAEDDYELATLVSETTDLLTSEGFTVSYVEERPVPVA